MPSQQNISHADAPSPSVSFEEEKKDFSDSTVLPTFQGESSAAEKERRRNEETQGGLQRTLNSRQISMISIAGTIGTGLFLGTGSALVTGGPGSLVLAYGIVGVLIFFLVHSLSEFVTQFPLAGGWPSYVHRFVDEPLAFAYGWLSVTGVSIAIGGDLVVTQLLLGFWTDRLVWLPALFFLAFLTATNLYSARSFGELEYWLSLLKVVSIVIFFILSIVANAGGNTEHRYIGAQYWTTGQAPFVNGFGGFASLFVNAAFAYGGTESVGLAAAETRNPTRNIKRIANRVLARILIFYILTLILISFNIPYTYPNLATASTATSPFTIIFDMVGSKVGGSFMNTVILTSVLSAANMGTYGTSRILYGMALRGHAPRKFASLTSRGVPWLSTVFVVVVSLAFFGISFLPGGAGQIWVWCQALVGINNLFGWVFIGLTSWRMRSAWVKQGKPITALKAPSICGAWGARVVVVAFIFIILVQGWSSFKQPFHAKAFVQSYLEIPVLFVLYWSFRLIKKSKTPALADIDLITGTYDDSADDDEDNEKIERREHGRLGFLWKAYSWVA